MSFAATSAQTIGLEVASWMPGIFKRSSPSSVYALNRSTITRIERPRGRRITCVSGTLWLTFDGEPTDRVLEAGETMTCEHNSLLLISAFDKASWRAE